MRLGIDCDGVLANFNDSFIELVIKVTGKDLFPPRPFDIPTWYYPKHYGYTAKEINAVWEIIHADSLFWLGLPDYSSTWPDLQALSRLPLADIYFITARSGVDAKRQTEGWLTRNGYYRNPTVLLSSSKAMCVEALQLDAYIDDHLPNVKSASGVAKCRVFLLDRPWNQEAVYPEFGITRVGTVRGMLDHL